MQIPGTSFWKYLIWVCIVWGTFVVPIRANIVDRPPEVIAPPISVQTNITRTATFTVQATGSLPMSFQWFHNGHLIDGATESTYVRSKLDLGAAGAYSVRVSNAFGVVESSPATLEVGPLIGWEVSSAGCGYYFTSLPADPLDLVAVEAGVCHSLAMTRSGHLIGLGDHRTDQGIIPTNEPYTKIVAVAETQQSVLALRSDGTVVIWGYSITNVPSGLSGVVAIAAGRAHYLALRKDGTIVSWIDRDPSPVPPGLSNVVAISAWEGNSLALKRDGSVVGWGPTAEQYGTPVLTNAVAIASGGTHGLALLQTGAVVAWGAPERGATNVPPSLGEVVAISAGSYHSAALRADGTVVSWGNYYGTSTAAVPDGLTNVIAVSSGYEYTLAVAGDAHLSFWKQPEATNTIIVGHTNTLFGAAVGMPPIHYQWRRDGTNIPGATSTFLFLEDLNIDGDMRSYQLIASNAFGTAASAPAVVRVVDSPPLIFRQPDSVSTNFGRTVRFSVDADGSWPISYQWRLNGAPIPGATNTTLTLTNVSFAQEGAYSIVISNAYGSAVSAEAALSLVRVVAWGRNTAGETNPPSMLTNVVAISAGFYHGVALREDGSVIRWGARTNVPSGLVDVIQINSGGYHSIALQADGRVKVWDDAPLEAYYTNFADGLSNVVAVAAGESHFAALTSAGRVIVWALQGAVTNVPASATNVVTISAAANYCLAIRDNGTVLAWGSGPTNVPVGLTNVVSIDAGPTTAVAIRRDGGITAWNSSGVLALPASLTNLSSAAVGSTHGLALKREGLILPWGTSSFGQTNFPRNFSNYIAVATDFDFGLGLLSTGPPRLWHSSVFNSNLFSGEPIFLRARAVGRPPLTYQWQLNGTNIVGATNANLAIMTTSPLHAGLYRVIVSNDLGLVVSGGIPIDVTESAPLVTSHPVSVETNLFSDVQLTVGAIGSKPWAYQWRSNAIPIPGATGPALTISNLQVGQSGLFNVVLSNSFGVVQSAAAGINVRPVVAWGSGLPASTNIAPAVTNVATVFAGAYHNVAMRRDGSLIAWGTNSYGILQEPVPLGLSNVLSMAFGPDFGVAARSDGRIAIWGSLSNAPSLTNAVSVSAGSSHALALTAAGDVVAWGDNSWGQSEVPPGLHDVVEIAAGYTHNVARRKDGTVIVWGRKTDAIEFARGLSNVVAISAFNEFNLAATADGKVIAWGSNLNGEDAVPPTATNVVQIAAGDRLGVALRGDGTVVQWGAQSAAPTAVPAGLRTFQHSGIRSLEFT